MKNYNVTLEVAFSDSTIQFILSYQLKAENLPLAYDTAFGDISKIMGTTAIIEITSIEEV